MRNGKTESEPIWSQEAEYGLIGAVLLKHDLIDEIPLTGDEFRSVACAKLWKTIATLHSEGVMELAVLVERLRRNGDLDDVGGEPFLAGLLGSYYTSVNAHQFGVIVREKFRIRKTLEAVGKAAHSLMEHQPRQEVVAVLESELSDISADKANEPVPLKDLLMTAIFSEKEQTETLASGFDEIDELTGGFEPGQLIIIGARPGLGKTAFAACMAMRMAEMKVPVLFLSLEMSGAEVTQRIVAASGEIALRDIRTARQEPETVKKIAETGNRIFSLPLLIDDTAGVTITEVERITRHAIRKHGVRIVFIDYLGLVEPDDSRKNRYEQVSILSRKLKLAAKRLRVPIVALHQLNREVESQKDHRPKLSHLRDSGSIEQDADIVMFIHREGRYDSSADQNAAELIVEKVRNGKTGSVPLVWEGCCTRFSEVAKEPEYTMWTPGGF